MRLSALGAGLLLSFVIVTVHAGQASAESISVTLLQPSKVASDKLAVLDIVQAESTAETNNDKKAPEPVKHLVLEGETLSKIAEKYQTTWVRLFNKNAHIADPDVLSVGAELVIPALEEQLVDRPLPTKQPEPIQQSSPVIRQRSPVSGAVAVSSARGSSAGNTYSWGYCTWYVKNRRPDLPNNLGNAMTWTSRAASQGIATGSEPRAGAVGQRGNHVVYVESVNGDGTITISEMNYQAVGVMNTRTVPANYFQYIY